MTFSTPRSVASGKLYPVREVSGGRPQDLADLAGRTDAVLDLSAGAFTAEHVVS
jgi:hypothetical protein